ncbi:PE-PPE domain-containing protein [[Mycobacterium] wendilense]|uniref:PE-PPE domain-containing protein n=1 Tax=[Mycobacterium] wendilense TaxID=3064284 RepID=A0ABM9MCP8_9MYCO|nr:PE-PPE domain-containing protein [Mycolicibacterium sp. MU0050]CAJ1582002.1 PE-PPE domain-containing protein [Mycolicibacterium sp. MU0050]
MGRHRAQRDRRWSAGATASVVAAAGVTATVVGLTPTLAASPDLLAQTYYLRGTNIGDEPTDAEFTAFMDRVFAGTGTAALDDDPRKIDYNAGFWPVSRGGFDDLKWDASVAQGAALLGQEHIGAGDVVFAFSQGAVAASKYKGEHPDTGATFVLVENPNRPNGGVLARFAGLKIPVLDVTFSGATPDNGDLTLDIARQYSGWSDFPTYPLNLLATANAVAGIVYLHGPTQRVEDLAAQLEAIEAVEGAYYQQRGDTTYYLIPTDRLPLLRPFDGIVPEPILAAVNEPLRVLVETGYDRTDYSAPTRAKLIPKINPVELAEDLAEATGRGISKARAPEGDSAPTADADDEAPQPLAAAAEQPPAQDPAQDLERSDRSAALRLKDRREARRAALAGADRDSSTTRKAGSHLKKALRALAPKPQRKLERDTDSRTTDDGPATTSDDKSETSSERAAG